MSDPSPQVNNAPPSPQSLQSPPLSPDAGKNISALKHDILTPSDPQQGPLTPPATPLASGPEFSDEDFTLSNSNANTDNEGNLVSVDNTNAVSIPFDDPIGVSEIPSKGDVTPVDTQSNDATDAATATAATNTATVEDDTMAKAVATTVSPEETFAAAIADGGPVSASDSAAEDVIGSGAKDVVDSTAALKPTPADATGVAGGSIVAVSNIEPLASTASSTTTADALTPVEETIITTTEDVVVAKATTAAQDTVRCAEIDNSIESPSTVPVESPSVVPIERVSVTVTAETPPTVAVVTASCTLADSAFTTSVAEENVADSSATNETQSAEDHTVRQKDRAGQSDNELKVKEELEPAKKKSLKKNKRAEKEPVRKKEPVKNGKDKAKKWTGESVKKENEKATEEPKVTQDEKETQRPSHIFIDTPNNICSFEDSEGRRLCASRVLTVSMGPLICDRHRSRHDFVYHNKYISILLVKDFKDLVKRYPRRKQVELHDKIKKHFKTLFQNHVKDSLGGLEGTIKNQLKISYVKKGFLYTFDYTKNVSTWNKDVPFNIKIGHTTCGASRFPVYSRCAIRDKPSDAETPPTPLSTFPSQTYPHAKSPSPTVGCLTLFEKVMHCLYREVDHKNYFCGNETCKVTARGHKEIFLINGTGTYDSAREAALRRIEKDMSLWGPFFTLLGSDIGSSCLGYALRQLL